MTLQTTIKSVLVLRQRFRLIQLGFSLGDQSFEFFSNTGYKQKEIKTIYTYNHHYGIGSVSLFQLQVCIYQVIESTIYQIISAILNKFDKQRFKSCGKQIIDRTRDGAAEMKECFSWILVLLFCQNRFT